MRGPVPVGLRQLAYGLYKRRLAAALDPDAVPRHVGVIVDGNRRWARAAGAGAAAGDAARGGQGERRLGGGAGGGGGGGPPWALSAREPHPRAPERARA